MMSFWDDHGDWRDRLNRARVRLVKPARTGLLRRTTPLSDAWGYDRGLPIDRYYIEAFLDSERDSVTGRVLEVRDDRYTRQFGTGVVRSDVVDIDRANPRATIIADLAAADEIEDGSFDCFILVQTLQFVFSVDEVLRHAHRILAPGGTLLCTVPAVSKVSPRCLGSEYWRFTVAGLGRLAEGVFDREHIRVCSFGNVLACVGFLHGLATEDLSPSDLEPNDPLFPLIIALRARKSA